MLNNISKILSGDMLKALCDMGHGDTLVLADANFPGQALSEKTNYGKLIRCPGVNASDILMAIIDLFPLDVNYSEYPAAVMDLTEGDKKKGMPDPEAWEDYCSILNQKYEGLTLGKIERFDFYDKAAESYVIFQTGEERQYGNIILTKGCVL